MFSGGCVWSGVASLTVSCCNAAGPPRAALARDLVRRSLQWATEENREDKGSSKQIVSVMRAARSAAIERFGMSADCCGPAARSTWHAIWSGAACNGHMRCKIHADKMGALVTSSGVRCTAARCCSTWHAVWSGAACNEHTRSAIIDNRCSGVHRSRVLVEAPCCNAAASAGEQSGPAPPVGRAIHRQCTSSQCTCTSTR